MKLAYQIEWGIHMEITTITKLLKSFRCNPQWFIPPQTFGEAMESLDVNKWMDVVQDEYKH
jgi:hypothetical protein